MKAKHRLTKNNGSTAGNEHIRKWLILVLALVLVKILYALTVLNSGTVNNSLINMFNADVAAEEDEQKKPAAEGDAAPVADNATADAAAQPPEAWSIELANALKQRERELALRQDVLRQEEERLNSLKRDLEGRLQTLAQLEKKISDLISTKKGIEEEKIMKLAKVFEETPPEQAGPLMSKLDVDIAVELLLKMTGRKAGKIWGFVDPGRAVEISKALARINPNIDLSRLSDNKSAER